MVRHLAAGFALAALVACVFAAGSLAASDEVPFQIALVHPVQLRGAELGILGVRLNLIYGRNVSVKGLDLGLINHSTGGTSVGLQYGIVGYIGGDFDGWQDDAFAIVRGRFRGFQSGVYNEAGSGEGFQMGFLNRASDMRGFQLGFVNSTQTMHGLQIGLVNMIREREEPPWIMPIVNWSF
jgi:hypothetical protein